MVHCRFVTVLSEVFAQTKSSVQEYSYQNGFGSFYVALKKSGRTFRLVWDGRESTAELQVMRGAPPAGWDAVKLHKLLSPLQHEVLLTVLSQWLIEL